MLRQSSAGHIPIPRIPLSWLGTVASNEVIGMQRQLDTEAERLTGAFTNYLSQCSDEDAFNFGAYNTIPRTHGIRPQELVRHCAAFIDCLIPATQGTAKVHCKRALEAAILEALHRNPSRRIRSEKPRHELVAWIRNQVKTT